MSDNTDDRPEGSHNASTPDAGAAHGATSPSPQPDRAPLDAAAGADAGRPPLPTRSPAAAAAAWPPPQSGDHRTPAGAAAVGGASGAAFGPAATDAHGLHPTLTLPESSTTAPRKKSGVPKVAALVLAAALVGGGAGLGGTYAGLQLWGGSSASSPAGATAVTVNNPDSVNATTAIASKVVPSVVTISATGSTGAGTGSGVVLNSDGYVLTNTHVVTLDGQSGNTRLSVTTSDGRVFAATLVGTDPTYDLAVIKLENASGLTPIEWADSSDLNVGDTTVAVGAPLGLSNTVTTGIVSALNRSIQVASSAAPSDGSDESEGGQGGQESPFFFDFGQGQQQSQSTETIKIAVIQTDAAINPGNSGGALVDDQGRLIGINVAIASAGGSSSSSGQSGSIGVGFAIPSDVAKRVSSEIIENGSATHGLLGASVQDSTSVQGATITGAYVAEVSPGGAAAGGGLQTGDIITAFNGVPVASSVDLTAQVRALAAGATAQVTYVRNGQDRTAEVTLGSLNG
ncbi:S1C family serine protease [Microbacterium sp. LMI1-1-1.1]|uniref:S1C family serine protease n=1 Tax=Microbacterium sp. LMI1-1-1.1 TaxID=3135223 RepID=UPI0034659DCD